MKEKRIRKRKMKALKRNFLARLRPAKLNYFPGPWILNNHPTSRSRKRRAPRETSPFHGINQKFLDYYGITIIPEVNQWSPKSRADSRFHGHLLKYRNTEFYKNKLKSDRRRLDKFVKRSGLEHKLNN